MKLNIPTWTRTLRFFQSIHLLFPTSTRYKIAEFELLSINFINLFFFVVSPMIWVPNQLVGAPAGTDVTVDCHTEAHPRAISYWVYDNVMVLPTKKYGIITTENSYR